MTEPGWRRDVGPYRTAEQALAQRDATTYGIPGGETIGNLTVLGEALMLTGVRPPAVGYEAHVMNAVALDLPPAMVQVLAGWLFRAWKAGADRDGLGPDEKPLIPYVPQGSGGWDSGSCAGPGEFS